MYIERNGKRNFNEVDWKRDDSKIKWNKIGLIDHHNCHLIDSIRFQHYL